MTIEEQYAPVIHTENPSCLVCTPIDGYKITDTITITGVNQVNIIGLGEEDE